MQLTRHSDYSLRVLIYLALRPEELCNITDIANTFNISRNHLVKVVHNLSKSGYIQTVRGHGGGLKLAGIPGKIRIGEVVRKTESSLEVINCEQPLCPILPACKLKHALAEATEAFLDALNDYTIADLVRDRVKLNKLIA